MREGLQNSGERVIRRRASDNELLDTSHQGFFLRGPERRLYLKRDERREDRGFREPLKGVARRILHDHAEPREHRADHHHLPRDVIHRKAEERGVARFETQSLHRHAGACEHGGLLRVNRLRHTGGTRRMKRDFRIRAAPVEAELKDLTDFVVRFRAERLAESLFTGNHAAVDID